ncbi:MULTISPECIES: nuclear transport factor 2 family protein [Cyanophyceae]|uniref:nuclear transport factor 2 family protein n=1 Tax=Cyanophyceae TaxID=3028117 RepID=UPI00232BA53A|nr:MULTISPECIES: nuclear transport factor 2 family protein [Cyanophyceae]MDB9357913.1 nuclear transport factor 2 family protein [Nodularia spumigena CS-587/03]MDB9304093.1 nuclear transport factor 2 family protein [Nodularia spumigena CS-591/12]MDB9319492.1 nuclear transport factor 2 family protein [Nodularia spumigena CS-590/01A]MDB9323097.1 nuclear transport factor 2 family protein [Nodularia spumigena CS-591/07A]MDB9325681.1 nuclear transport factor 2 family protein [Nodularia spumigena CS-
MSNTITLSNIAAKKELIVTLFAAVDSSDWNLLKNCFDENIIYERPGYQPFIGLDKLLNFYRYERIIASGQHYLEHITIDNNHGACWGKFIGIHKNGSPINERFADVYCFDNGKFKTRRSYFFRPAV